MSSSSDDIIICKQRIMSALVNDDDIVGLIDDSLIGNGDELLYNNIYPYQRVPDTEDEMKTYICFKVNTRPTYAKNKAFKDIIVTLYIITHQNLMRCDRNGTRIDFLGSLVLDIFNGKDGFGIGEVEVVSDTEGNSDFLHRYREIIFKTKGLSKDVCGE